MKTAIAEATEQARRIAKEEVSREVKRIKEQLDDQANLIRKNEAYFKLKMFHVASLVKKVLHRVGIKEKEISWDEEEWGTLKDETPES